MSTPIKPPGGPDAPDPSPEPETAGKVEGAAGEFKEVVEAAASTAAEAAAEGVSAGHLDPGEAIEQLVQRALSSAQGLTDAHRAELEAQLRAALEEDPTLVALQEDLQSAAKP